MEEEDAEVKAELQVVMYTAETGSEFGGKCKNSSMGFFFVYFLLNFYFCYKSSYKKKENSRRYTD